MTAVLAESDGVSRSFGANLAVDRVSLSMTSGEILGLVGANGAGKTTLIRLLLGLERPDAGNVRLFDQPPTRATRSRIGYMPQTLGLYDDLTVAENLSFSAGVFGVDPPRLDDDLARVADTTVKAIPLGLRRRVAFLAALAHRPELLVLDEPTSGVGPLGRADLWETIHESADDGSGVLVTTHHMDEAEQCDRLVFITAGRLVASGTAGEIVASHATVEATPADPPAALESLERAGMSVLPAGRHLRVPGASLANVRAVLGAVPPLSEQPSTLEEAFMILARAS
ncbi:MAG TPA: ABC transporter ATP-binding protein [Acidimicrobiia bacterium]|nr:ABC transporter ATP-binding protein [Acidimicrobiia bacterium]